MKRCELCNSIARMFCESDQASLCWECDAKVHSANFIVAKHSRTLLCQSCQAPTPWTGSGSKLGSTVSVCETCVLRNSSIDHSHNRFNNDDYDEEEYDEDNDDDDYNEGDDDHDENEDEGENQVVPLAASTSLAAPEAWSYSTSDESCNGGQSSELSRISFPWRRNPSYASYSSELNKGSQDKSDVFQRHGDMCGIKAETFDQQNHQLKCRY